MDQVLHLLSAKASSGGKSHVWFLLDGVMLDEGERAVLSRKAAHKQRILTKTKYTADDDDDGPWIMQAPDSQPERTKWLERLVKACDGLPVLSIVETEHSQEFLEEAFAALVIATTNDRQRFYCRFADTRVIPSLAQSLSKRQITAITSTIQRWHHVNRFGILEQALCAEKDQPVVAPVPLALNTQQFAQMLEDSEPDNIFGLLCELTPELVPKDNRGAFHAKLKRILDEARKKKVTDAPDQLQFTILALSCGEQFHHNPVLRDTWARIYANAGKLQDQMKDWPKEIWKALETNTLLQN